MAKPDWDKIRLPKKKPPDPRAFIQEVIQVMRRHGLSIAHEDCGGGFIIEPYHEVNVKWFRGACVNISKKED